MLKKEMEENRLPLKEKKKRKEKRERLSHK
jgi:hypothetical protein